MWNEISKKIRERDKDTCFKCGLIDKTNHIHHISPRCISKNDNPDNLICLCSKCHRQTENDFNRLGVTNFHIKMLDTAFERSLL